MKARAKEVPHEFTPVELSITLHTHQELLALSSFMKLSDTLAVQSADMIQRGVVSIPFFQEFVAQFMDLCQDQLKDYVNQYNPPGAKID